MCGLDAAHVWAYKCSMQATIHEQVLAHLEAAKGNWPRVARESGVSIRTLSKIARREIVDPGISHVQKLYDYFAGRPQ